MDTTQTTTTAAEPRRLEIETCTRCGGGGKYSFCQMYGDRCFKCAGKGTTLSKRGHAASLYLRALRSKRADQVRVGDVMEFGGITMGGALYHFFATVTEAGTTEQTYATERDAAGEPIWKTRTLIHLVAGESKYGRHGEACEPESMKRVKQSPEDAARTFDLALAYQATLTKTGGKPTKRTAAFLASVAR